MEIHEGNINNIDWFKFTIDDFNQLKSESLKAKVRTAFHNWIKQERELDKERIKDIVLWVKGDEE